jgi:hypothetical protein
MGHETGSRARGHRNPRSPAISILRP